MLGVRFLDVDFMRINFARASPTVKLIRLFCTVVGTQASPRRQIGGPARGVAQPGWNASKSSARTCASPPGGGRAKIENSSRRHPRKFGVNYFWSGRLLVRNGVACFWATSFRKKRQQLS